jgi:hypothetical protein
MLPFQGKDCPCGSKQNRKKKTAKAKNPGQHKSLTGAKGGL